jgi:ferritin-like metal-binding protein YciE
MATREHLNDWLRDAHGMEKQALSQLEKQADRLDDYPDMRERVSRHVEETRRQAERIERLLDARGEKPSTMKDVAGRVMGAGSAMGTAMSSDEVVKNTLADYAFEHFEIASYRSLIAAAEAAGEHEIATVCRENLREEEAMAKWVGDHLETVTRSFLSRESSGGETRY